MSDDRFRAKERFSDRVLDYRRYRPAYPPGVLELVRSELREVPAPVIADIGAGTGIFSRLLLDEGFEVVAVEPNAPMRAAAEQALQTRPSYRSVAGSAEVTTLLEQSVDLITVAQAFHWFDPLPTRREFARILRPPGRTMLLWNLRRTDGDPFLEAYERFLQSELTDYHEVGSQTDFAVAHAPDFFDPGTCQLSVFPYQQKLDRSAWIGRVLSSSFVPGPADPRHPQVLAQLEELFRSFQTDGQLTMNYETKVFQGLVTAPGHG